MQYYPWPVSYTHLDVYKRQIQERMAEAGIRNMGAYMRKMALSGYVLHVDLSPVREPVSYTHLRTGNRKNTAVAGFVRRALTPAGARSPARGNCLRALLHRLPQSFNHPTNVKTDSRVVCIVLKNMGENLRKIAMHITNEFVSDVYKRQC